MKTETSNESVHAAIQALDCTGKGSSCHRGDALQRLQLIQNVEAALAML